MPKLFFEFLLLAIIAAILIWPVGFYFAKIIFSSSTKQDPQNSVCFGENCFQVELAKTIKEQENGLMHRTYLAPEKGMLFIFNNEAIYPFWMKNTLIPLDIIWINSESKIVFIAKNAQPCKQFICPQTFPLEKAKYVLEVNAGAVDKIGLRVGDLAKLMVK